MTTSGQFTMTVDTNNATFDDGLSPLCDILRDVADKLEAGEMRATLLDVNGNTIGGYLLTPRD